MADVIEVVTRFGDTILDIVHVAPNTTFVVDGTTINAAPGAIHAGNLALAMQRVPRPPRTLAHPAIADRRALGYIALSLAVHLCVWGFADAETEPEPPRPIVHVRHVRVPLGAGSIGITDDDGGHAGLGTPMRLVGEPSSGVGGDERQLARADAIAVSAPEAIEQARSAGVLGTLHANGFRTITGSADLSTAIDQPITRGDEALGGFGIGGRGFGPGGGCDGDDCGTIVAGRYGTIGHGTGTGEGWGEVSGAGGMRGRGREPIHISMCGAKMCAVSDDGLDKAIIRRYIRRALPKIQYCYEVGLLSDPTLSGTVVAEFTIAPTGTVTSSTATGANPTVASCIANVIRAIEFPAAHTKISTQVRYPFIVRLAGS